MSPHDINAILKKKGYTQELIASRLKIDDRSTISHVIHGRGRSSKVESLISELTNKPLNKLWPKWYQKTGRAAA